MTLYRLFAAAYGLQLSSTKVRERCCFHIPFFCRKQAEVTEKHWQFSNTFQWVSSIRHVTMLCSNQLKLLSKRKLAHLINYEPLCDATVTGTRVGLQCFRSKYCNKERCEICAGLMANSALLDLLLFSSRNTCGYLKNDISEIGTK